MHLLNLALLCFSIFTWKINGYVLLAANLDDFRSIAKRFVPAKLAEQIVEMASDSPNTEKIDPNILRGGDVYYEADGQTMESYEVIEENDNKKQREEVKKHDEEIQKHEVEFKRLEDEVKKRDNEATKPADEVNNPDGEYIKRGKAQEQTTINIDDIVEKVKERLEKHYILKLNDAEKIAKPKKAAKTTKKEETNDSESKDNEYDDQKPVRNIDSTQYVVSGQFTREYGYTTQQYTDIIAREPVRGKVSIKPAHKTTQNDYDNGEREANSDETVYKPVKAKPEKETRLFDAVDMRKSNDSYEDYVTPKKYQIFESDENVKERVKETEIQPTRYNVKAKSENVQKDPQWPSIKEKATEYDYDVTPGEIKARTENLMFEEKDIYREEIKNVTEKGAKVTTKKFKAGTMIPTMHYYRISSPNYYAKLPVIAEKYDFNEPIPERDREREDLRSIGNPPASINRKVKLL